MSRARSRATAVAAVADFTPENSHILRRGDHVECPQCQCWHVARFSNVLNGHPTCAEMLFVDCNSVILYVGRQGSPSPWRAKHQN